MLGDETADDKSQTLVGKGGARVVEGGIAHEGGPWVQQRMDVFEIARVHLTGGEGDAFIVRMLRPVKGRGAPAELLEPRRAERRTGRETELLGGLRPDRVAVLEAEDQGAVLIALGPERVPAAVETEGAAAPTIVDGAEGGELVEEVVIDAELEAGLLFEASSEIVEAFVEKGEVDDRFLGGIVFHQLGPDRSVPTHHLRLIVTRFGLFLFRRVGWLLRVPSVAGQRGNRDSQREPEHQKGAR